MRVIDQLLQFGTDEDLDWLAQKGKRVEMKASSRLIQEKSEIEALYIILDGEAAVTNQASGDTPVALLGPGEVIGELSFLDHRAPITSVTTTKPTTVLSISRDALNQKLASDIHFGALFYHAIGLTLARRLRRFVGTLGYGGATHVEAESTGEVDATIRERFEAFRQRVARA
jgi:CRP-like cAMP-binding protein